MTKNPQLISVVIPTRNRPALVLRSVQSALAQTWKNLEVLVVVDGPDVSTSNSLSVVNDSRLRIINLEVNVGGAEARNVGVRAAAGSLIALLDDDDEWLIDKLQLQIAGNENLHPVFVGSTYIERTPGRDRVMPKNKVNFEEHISDILFRRKSVFSGTGYLQTSSWLISRDLLLEIPFTKGLLRNQDADWLLRALTQPNIHKHVVYRPLVIFHDDHQANRVSKKGDWKFNYNWALSNKKHFTRCALAFYFLTACLQGTVLGDRPIRDTIFIIRSAFQEGQPNGTALVFAIRYGLSSWLRRLRQ